jgi:hypothetical protein
MFDFLWRINITGRENVVDPPSSPERAALAKAGRVRVGKLGGWHG